uniref:Secreted protein n=1 Tax=Romanomermis culicivorax TaxID=13658 RepID=A0A915IV12_ROMCU
MDENMVAIWLTLVLEILLGESTADDASILFLWDEDDNERDGESAPVTFACYQGLTAIRRLEFTVYHNNRIEKPSISKSTLILN